MDIPEKFRIREVIHGHGAKGLAFYGYEDVLGLGVQMEARRGDRRSPFVETWWLAALPDVSFGTLAALRLAAAEITDEAVAAEAAKYPFIRSAKPDECGNACRLCERPTTWPCPKYDTTRVSIATNWRAATDDFASLCADHMAQYQGDPSGLLAALSAEVAERKARAEARRTASSTMGANGGGA
jgi:hypothetical protein